MTRSLASRILKPAGWLLATTALVAACGNRWPGGRGGHGGHHHPRKDAGAQHDGGHDHEDGGHDHEDGGHDHEDGGHDDEDGGHDHGDGGHSHDAGAHSGATCPEGSTLTYENFAAPFFANYCTRCHSSQLSGAARAGAPPGADFDTLEGILAHAHHVDQYAAAGPEAANTFMPPSDPRPPLAERLQLGEWLACADGDDATTITWSIAPPQVLAVNTPFTARYTVNTEGELHVTELRACEGIVPDCGLHEFYSRVSAPAESGQYSATLTLPRTGTWTVVAWIHVDLDPHISEPVTVTVQ
ncbi:MAG TPA: hypothetical protein VK524_30570 [Polyangiaceae bacterium]|nr:hypothetical protein [Polyangiaceae bacterium]